jgi:hypothetical protein
MLRKLRTLFYCHPGFSLGYDYVRFIIFSAYYGKTAPNDPQMDYEN